MAQQEDSNSIAVKSIRLGVLIALILLVVFYFVWSSLSWDDRALVAWNILSLVTLVAFVFGILASAIQFTLGQESPFLSSLFKFPTEWLKYKAAQFEAKRNDMLTQEQLLQVNERAKQDVLDFIQVSRETLELIKSEIPVLVDSKYRNYLSDFEMQAKRVMESYQYDKKVVEGSTIRARAAMFTLMRKIIWDWLQANVVIDDIKEEEKIPDFCNAALILKELQSHDKVFYENDFSIPVVEKFCNKRETREFLWECILKQREVLDNV